MLKCHACHGGVEGAAKFCPHCGVALSDEPMGTKETIRSVKSFITGRALAFVGIAAVVVCIGIVAMVAGDDSYAGQGKASSKELAAAAVKARADACANGVTRLSEVDVSKDALLDRAKLWRSVEANCGPEDIVAVEGIDPEARAAIDGIDNLEGVRHAEEWVALKAAELAAQRGRQWVSYKGVSVVDDSPNVNISTSPTNVGQAKEYMTVRCLENTTSVVFNFDNYLGDDDASVYTQTKQVLLRLDDEVARTYTMSVSTDRESVGFWRGDQAIPFIKRMLKAEKLVIRITPYGESPTTLIYNIADLDMHLDPLRVACNW